MTTTSPIVLLYDGRCGLCKSSMKILHALDWFSVLQFENLHDPAVRNHYAPEISFEKLNAAMHIKLQDGTFRKGFFAFRRLCFALPLLWILAPFLYVPGVSWIGETIYEWVASHRTTH